VANPTFPPHQEVVATKLEGTPQNRAGRLRLEIPSNQKHFTQTMEYFPVVALWRLYVDHPLRHFLYKLEGDPEVRCG
jgi:hypothetical protein